MTTVFPTLADLREVKDVSWSRSISQDVSPLFVVMNDTQHRVKTFSLNFACCAEHETVPVDHAVLNEDFKESALVSTAEVVYGDRTVSIAIGQIAGANEGQLSWQVSPKRMGSAAKVNSAASAKPGDGAD